MSANWGDPDTPEPGRRVRKLRRPRRWHHRVDWFSGLMLLLAAALFFAWALYMSYHGSP